VVVSLESFHWDTAFLGQVPNDEGLVSGRRDQHFWELWVDGHLRDPITMALEGAAEYHNFLRHFSTVGFLHVSVSST